MPLNPPRLPPTLETSRTTGLGVTRKLIIPRRNPPRRGALAPPEQRRLAEVPGDIVRDGHVLDDAPGAAAAPVARRQHEARRPLLPEGGLMIDPAVLQDVAVDEHPLRVFQFEEVLDRPVDARVRGAAGPPTE